jgi:UDP-N-acetylmuramoyl-L-alanyl-D-glutamate--2,6-diaminopimelate ligase
MKLHQLFSFFGKSEADSADTSVLNQEVEAVCFDTRNIKPSSVFIAVKGTGQDGHDYLAQAAELGAIAMVVENKSKVPKDYPHLVVEVPDTRQALDLLASKFYNFPSQDLFCIGVTGTNGKTSITYFLEHIFNFHRKPAAVIGTVNHRLKDKVWDSGVTTPDPVTLQKRLREFSDLGAVAVAMEVSSHALEQKRVQSVNFNTVIFTNLTLDHLDYHGTMQNYFAAKQKLFTDLMWLTVKTPKFAVINVDDSYGRKLRVAEDVIAWTYGKRESDFQFKVLDMNFNETEIEITTATESHKFLLPVCGEHNAYNAVASAVAALSAGISLQQSFEALKSFSGVPGRLQRVESLSRKIAFVDYAHTPDALENVLKAIRSVRDSSGYKSRIITVFGCGGDRDKSKRPLMAKVASQLSDFVFVTSDNPRTESPQAIVDDIAAGLSGPHEIVLDRESAIKKSLQMADLDDIVLIAGKGHEDYQIIGTEKTPFSDLEKAAKYLRENL